MQICAEPGPGTPASSLITRQLPRMAQGPAQPSLNTASQQPVSVISFQSHLSYLQPTPRHHTPSLSTTEQCGRGWLSTWHYIHPMCSVLCCVCTQQTVISMVPHWLAPSLAGQLLACLKLKFCIIIPKLERNYCWPYLWWCPALLTSVIINIHISANI